MSPIRKKTTLIGIGLCLGGVFVWGIYKLFYEPDLVLSRIHGHFSLSDQPILSLRKKWTIYLKSIPFLSNSLDEPKPLPSKTLIVSGSSLTLNPNICEPVEDGFPWALGSVHIKVLGRKEDFCLFEYTREMEMGVSIFACVAPVNGPKIVIREVSRPDSGDFGNRVDIDSSFNENACKLIESGNIFSRLQFRKEMEIKNKKIKYTSTQPGAPPDADSGRR